MPRLPGMNVFPSQHAARSVTLAALLLASTALHAQTVRRCQIEGRQVFQSSPCPTETHVVARTMAPAAVEPITAPKKKTLAELLRERDGSERARLPAREFQGDGANVLRSRMGAV